MKCYLIENQGIEKIKFSERLAPCQGMCPIGKVVIEYN
jgi:hypothetical protein